MAKVKGTAVLPLVKLLRLDRARAVQHLPERLQHYLDDWCASNEWYPEIDQLGLLRAVLESAPDGRDATLADFGRIAANDQVANIFSHLIDDRLDVTLLSARLGTLWSAQHDTGQLRFRVDGRDRGQVELLGYDSSSPEMCLVVGGYCTRLLELANLQHVRLEKKECVLQGARRCLWCAKWS